MMGIVLDRPFPVFPDGFSPDVIAEFSRLTGRGVLGNKAASGTADHRRARPRAHAHRLADRLHVGRQRVSDRGARRRSCRCRSCIAPARSRTSWSARGSASAASSRGRSSARPGSFKRTANRRDYALPPAGETLLDRLTAASRTGRRDRQDRGSVRRPRHHAARFTRRATTRGWTRSSGRWPALDRGLIFANLVDFDTQYGHRNDVAGYAREPRAVRRAACGAAAAPARRRPADRHRRPRQRSDDAEHRSLARVRAAARRGRAACAAAWTSARAATFADLGQTLADVFGVGPLAHGTSFLHEII